MLIRKKNWCRCKRCEAGNVILEVFLNPTYSPLPTGLIFVSFWSFLKPVFEEGASSYLNQPIEATFLKTSYFSKTIKNVGKNLQSMFTFKKLLESQVKKTKNVTSEQVQLQKKREKSEFYIRRRTWDCLWLEKDIWNKHALIILWWKRFLKKKRKRSQSWLQEARQIFFKNLKICRDAWCL